MLHAVAARLQACEVLEYWFGSSWAGGKFAYEPAKFQGWFQGGAAKDEARARCTRTADVTRASLCMSPRGCPRQGAALAKGPPYTCRHASAQEIKAKFLPTYQSLVAGELDGWLSHPANALAGVIVLDQFSRNMFRDTPQVRDAEPLGAFPPHRTGVHTPHRCDLGRVSPADVRRGPQGPGLDQPHPRERRQAGRACVWGEGNRAHGCGPTSVCLPVHVPVAPQDTGLCASLPFCLRGFLIMPFEHSEALEDQRVRAQLGRILFFLACRRRWLLHSSIHKKRLVLRTCTVPRTQKAVSVAEGLLNEVRAEIAAGAEAPEVEKLLSAFLLYAKKHLDVVEKWVSQERPRSLWSCAPLAPPRCVTRGPCPHVSIRARRAASRTGTRFWAARARPRSWRALPPGPLRPSEACGSRRRRRARRCSASPRRLAGCLGPMPQRVTPAVG